MNRLDIGAAEFGILAGMLRKVDFFSPLTIGQIEKLLPAVMLHEYRGGETVFKQGAAGDAFYIVHQGQVEVRVNAGLMGLFPKTVAKLGPGSFFGEIALISSEPRTATVRCAEPSRLFTLVASDFQSVLKENPAAAQEMGRIAERRKFESRHAS